MRMRGCFYMCIIWGRVQIVASCDDFQDKQNIRNSRIEIYAWLIVNFAPRDFMILVQFIDAFIE